MIKAHAFEAIARRVAGDSDKPKLLCGDFNAPWSEDADGPVPVLLRRKWPEDIKSRWIEAEKGVVANAQMRDVYRDVHDPKMPFPPHTSRGAPPIATTTSSPPRTSTPRAANTWATGLTAISPMAGLATTPQS